MIKKVKLKIKPYIPLPLTVFGEQIFIKSRENSKETCEILNAVSDHLKQLKNDSMELRNKDIACSCPYIYTPVCPGHGIFNIQCAKECMVRKPCISKNCIYK